MIVSNGVGLFHLIHNHCYANCFIIIISNIIKNNVDTNKQSSIQYITNIQHDNQLLLLLEIMKGMKA
jgi:hypothetical protein